MMLRTVATELAWRLAPPRRFSARGPVALVYHGIPAKGSRGEIDAEVLDRQVRFLAETFELVSARSLNRGAWGGKGRVLLTFDDGFRNNVEVAAPILKKYGAPALFFVSTRHLTSRRWLWFAWLRAMEEFFPEDRLSFRGRLLDMSAENRRAAIAELRTMLLSLNPHPAAMYDAIESELPDISGFVPPDVLRDRFEGMTSDQLRELSSDALFTIGAHTVDHPMLTLCSENEARAQIQQGRSEIERITGRRCEYFAYPADDHNAATRSVCAELDFQAVFSVHRTVAQQPQLTMPRVGIYYPGLAELGCKVQWNQLLRQIRLLTLTANN